MAGIGGSTPARAISTNTLEPVELKLETLRWIFSITGALFIYFVVAKIVLALYHPDIDALKADANRVLLLSTFAYPKPVETLLF